MRFVAVIWILIISTSCNLFFAKSPLEKQVRSRYDSEADTFKIMAVDFIFENLSYHSFPYNDPIKKGKEWYKLMRIRPISDHSFLRDSLLRSLALSRPLKLGRDVGELDSAYICENIDMAFKVWRVQYYRYLNRYSVVLS